jgi:hypothetical protein
VLRFANLAVRANLVRPKIGTSSGVSAMTVHQQITVPTEAFPAPVCSSKVWDDALEARETAKLAYELHEAQIYRPLDETLDSVAPRPALLFEVTMTGGRIGRFNLWPKNLNEHDNHACPIVRERAALVRERWLHHLAVRKLIGWDEASDELERLCGQQCDRESELVKMPAPDLAALHWKLEHLFGPEAREPGDFGPSWCAAYLDALLADCSRLLVC